MTGTNVPGVTFAPTGFVAPAESAVLAGVSQDINTAFGGNLNFGTTGGSLTNATPQGQLAASMAAIIGNVYDTFLHFSTQTDPAFAEGRMQDAIGRIYDIERNGPIPTTLLIQCTGAVGTVIPIGALIADPGGNPYACLGGGVIGASGTVALTFAATATGSLGALAVPASVSIFQAITGWDTATLLSGVQGQPTESRAAFETRRGLSTAANSLGSLPSVLGTVLSVPGVLQAYVTENTQATPQTVGNVSLAANSIYVAAFGGNPQQVAQAIWSKKAPGCAYAAGNTTVTIQDTSPGYAPPFPAYTVTYQIPNPLPLLFSVAIVNSVAVPANATQLIQNAIIAAAAGNPNAVNVIDGPAATIGAKIWASRFVPPIAALGTWAQGNVISIQIGSNNNSDAATALGYCTGTSLFVTSLTSGSIGVGQTVSISNGSGVVIPGTTILSQVSGSAGGTGVYTVSALQYLGIGNLVLQSNNFSTTWATSNCTITGTAGTSPDGTNDAWTWQRSGTANASVSQTIPKTAAGIIFTYSIDAKPGTGNYLGMFISDGSVSSFTNNVDTTFNLVTGQVSLGPAIGGGANPFSLVSTSVQPAANGFFRCSVTVQTNTATTLFMSFSGNSNNVTTGGTDILSNTTIQVFGAQIDVGSAVKTYVPSGASAAVQQVLGLATADQTSVAVHLDQIPQVAAGNIAVSYQ